MKKVLIICVSVIQIIIPLISAFIMTFFESELEEAILAGLLIGLIISAITATILLIINRKYKIKFVKVISISMIIPICIFGLMYIMAHSY